MHDALQAILIMQDYKPEYDLNYLTNNNRATISKWIIDQGLLLREQTKNLTSSVLNVIPYISSTRISSPKARCRALTESIHHLNGALEYLGEYITLEARSYNSTELSERTLRQLLDEGQGSKIAKQTVAVVSCGSWIVIPLILLTLLLFSMVCVMLQEGDAMRRKQYATGLLVLQSNRDIRVIENKTRLIQESTDRTEWALQSISRELHEAAVQVTESDSAMVSTVEKTALSTTKTLNLVDGLVHLCHIIRKEVKDSKSAKTGLGYYSGNYHYPRLPTKSALRNAVEESIGKEETKMQGLHDQQMMELQDLHDLFDGLSTSSASSSPTWQTVYQDDDETDRWKNAGKPLTPKGFLPTFIPIEWPPLLAHPLDWEEMMANMLFNSMRMLSPRIVSMNDVNKQFPLKENLEELARHFNITVRHTTILQASCLGMVASEDRVVEALCFPYCYIPDWLMPQVRFDALKQWGPEESQNSLNFSRRAPIRSVSTLMALAEIGECMDKEVDLSELAVMIAQSKMTLIDGKIVQLNFDPPPLLQEQYLSKMYHGFRNKAPHGMLREDFPEGDEEFLASYKRPISLTKGGREMLRVLQNIFTTDQATDCRNMHVNCTICRGCKRRVLCPTNCRFCVPSLDYHTDILTGDDQYIPENAMDLHDLLTYVLIYETELPAAQLTKYPFMRDRNCHADRATTRNKWKGFVVSANALQYYNRITKCSQCRGFHYRIAKKEGPQPCLMGKVNYQSVNNGHSQAEGNGPQYPITIDDRQTRVTECPPPRTFEEQCEDALTPGALAVKGFGLANLHRCTVAVSATELPVNDYDVLTNRVPTKWHLSSLRTTLDGVERPVVTSFGASADPVPGAMMPIDGSDAVAHHYNVTRAMLPKAVHFNQPYMVGGFRQHLQNLIHETIYPTPPPTPEVQR